MENLGIDIDKLVGKALQKIDGPRSFTLMKIVFQGRVKEDVGVNVFIASLLYFFIIKNRGRDILDRIGAHGTMASRSGVTSLFTRQRSSQRSLCHGKQNG